MHRKKPSLICANHGFTLIEMIVVMILVAIMTAGFGSVLVTAIEGFLFAQNASDLSQKTQLALARINRELTVLTAITTADANNIEYQDGNGATYRISKAADQITMERTAPSVVAAKTLIDSVDTNYGSSSFLTYRKSDNTVWTAGTDSIDQLAAIQVVLILTITGDSQQHIFQTTINPRANTVPIIPRMS